MPLVTVPRSQTIARRVCAALVSFLLLSVSIGTWAASEPDRGVMADFAALQTYLTGLRKDDAPVPTAGCSTLSAPHAWTTPAATPAKPWPA